ncbi:MAG: hypothetical protein AAB512_04600 [Patescibacteria group bacterium]
MNDLGLEQKEEFDVLYKRLRNLEVLVRKSAGKLLSAENIQDALEALYEWNFYHIGLFQIDSQKDRFSYGGGAEINEMALNSKRLQEQIQLGDWKEAKEEFKEMNVHDGVSITTDHAEELGLNPDLTFGGVKLFQSDFEGDNEIWENFVNKQLGLIPDKTEPYVYSGLEVLKKSVEISS